MHKFEIEMTKKFFEIKQNWTSETDINYLILDINVI